MPSETIDLFNPARTPYQDSDLFGIGYGPSPTPTYKGNLADLVTYLFLKSGTGLVTSVGDVNYSMRTADFELVTQTSLSASRTWTLVTASSLAAGQRRRFVDLAGVIGTFALAISPAGSDRIEGVNSAIILTARFSYLVLETDGVNNWTIVERGPSLIAANNLGDLFSAAAARTNLGLGSAATQNVNTFLLPPNNLSDLVNKATARTNLGLGALATLAAVAFGNLDPSAIATLQQLLNATAQKLVTTDVLWGSLAPVTINWASSVVWDFGTFNNAIYSVSSGNSTISSAINAKPGQQGYIIVKQGSIAHTLGFPSSFNFMTSTTTIYAGANSASMIEYFVETPSIIHVRMNQNI